MSDGRRPGIGRKLYNFAAFQLGWFACVLGATSEHAWFGPTVVAAILVVHLVIARKRHGEFAFLTASIPIGLLVNTILQSSGAVVAPGPSIGPIWLLVLWPLFATLFNESMAWMRGRLLAGIVFGAVGAPLSYWAGARAGALELGANPAHWIPIVAVSWACAMLALLLLQARLTPIRA